MKLVLVESPTKARKLTTYLGDGYVVRASIGHIRDLPKSKMGLDLEHDFAPEYLIPRDKTKVVKELKTLAAKADEIVLATDPDREGEAIGWHLQEVLGNGNGTAKSKISADHFVRATFHEITKSAILAALANPTHLNMDLVNAQQARRVLDRLVGYSVSPVLWKKIRYGLSAGRVQSVALRLIVEREREITAFKPEEYWEVDVTLDAPAGQLVARVVEYQQKAYSPVTKNDVEPLTSWLPQAKYTVTTVEKKERRRVSLPPFTTSTLQQQSATRFGYTSKNTMRLAQQMYEEGFITYHRTDSVNLAQQAISMAREYIAQAIGAEYVPEKPRYFATSTKNAQEAHEAIRPTEVKVSADQIRERLGEQHAKLYDLIWRRFVASQMEAAVYDQTTVMIEAVGAQAEQNASLKSAGSTLEFAGWMKLFPNQGDVILPEVAPQQELGYRDLNAAQKFTEPPPRYNDASLIKTLEKEGIGRPSTYASIISVIEDRGYVERKEKKFVPTAIGMAVIDFLVKYFDKIVDYKFTANMEDDLDAVSRGEKQWQSIVHLFYTPLAKQVESVVATAERAPLPVEKTGESCPKCGTTEHGEIVIRDGRYGKFRSCSRFPECDFTEPIVNKLEGVTCPLCHQGDVVMKPTRYGKDFYGCSRYPACDWASWTKPKPGETITPEEWAARQAERVAKKAAREAAGEAGGPARGGRFGRGRFAKRGAKAASKTTAKSAAKPVAKTKTKAKAVVKRKTV